MDRTFELNKIFGILWLSKYELLDAWEIAEYSNFVQKSLAYLNLILPKKYGIFCIEEACKKSLACNRKILYKYHLDLSWELDVSLRNVHHKNVPRCCSNDILVNRLALETREFEDMLHTVITETLIETNQKVKFIHKFSKLAKNLKFVVENNYIYENGLILLCVLRADSNIIKDFLTVMKFDQLYFLETYMEVFEFILHRAHSILYNLWPHPPNLDLIYASIYLQKYRKTVSLLQYFIPRFCNKVYESMKKSDRLLLVQRTLQSPIEKGPNTRERHFLILQILCVFHEDRLISLKALQMLWRSIPDPFITSDELDSVFSRPPNVEILEEIGSFVEEIGGEVLEERVSEPRKLKHYCRHLIRSVLCNNEQLPTGIDELNLPSAVKSYLRLEL